MTRNNIPAQHLYYESMLGYELLIKHLTHRLEHTT